MNKYIVLIIVVTLYNIKLNAQIVSKGSYNNNSQKIGLWEYTDEKGNIILKVDYKKYTTGRIGAICRDNWRSHSTGRGTCSHHGGVKKWLYGSRIIADTVFIDKKIQPLAREYSGVDNLSLNYKINPKIKYHYEFNLLQQSLPNSYIDNQRIIWHPDNTENYHYTQIKNVKHISEDENIYKVVFCVTKNGKGLTIPISDGHEYKFWGSDEYFTIIIYKYTKDGYIPTDYKFIQKNYPYEATLDDVEIYRGTSSHIKIESFKLMYGIYSKKMDVFKILDDKLVYEIDDYYLSSSNLDETTINDFNSEVIFQSNSFEDKLIITSVRTKDKEEFSQILNLYEEGKYKSIENLVIQYYQALKDKSYNELYDIYCNRLINYHSLNNIGVEKAIKDHKNYLSKYTIKSFTLGNNTISKDDGKVTFMLEYSIIRKEDKKELNFILSISMQIEENKICSIKEKIVKRF